MRIVNVHERQLAASPAKVGALLDSLASDHDGLWPRANWPHMYLDRPLGEGATGGHGPIAYRVTRYVPGTLVEFRFLGPRGFDGGHVFEVEPIDAASARVRHTIRAELSGTAVVSWPVAIRHLHDALLEDAFAQAEASLGLVPVVKPWSTWVKVLRLVMGGGRTTPQRVPKPVSHGS